MKYWQSLSFTDMCRKWGGDVVISVAPVGVFPDDLRRYGADPTSFSARVNATQSEGVICLAAPYVSDVGVGGAGNETCSAPATSSCWQRLGCRSGTFPFWSS